MTMNFPNQFQLPPGVDLSPTASAPLPTAGDIAKLNAELAYLTQIDILLQQTKTASANILTTHQTTNEHIDPREILNKLYGVSYEGSINQPKGLIDHLSDLKTTLGNLLTSYNKDKTDLSTARSDLSAARAQITQLENALSACRTRPCGPVSNPPTPNPGPIVVVPSPNTGPIVVSTPPTGGSTTSVTPISSQSNILPVVIGVGVIGALAAGAYYFMNKPKMAREDIASEVAENPVRRKRRRRSHKRNK